MKPLRLIALVAALLVVILVAALLWPASRPQWLDLPDGRSVRIYAVTYGTNHVAGSLLGRLIARLPQKLGDPLVKLTGNRLTVSRITTAAPELVVWLEQRNFAVTPVTSRYTLNPQSFLCDSSNHVSGGNVWGSTWFGSPTNSTRLVPAICPVFPRRNPVISMVFFCYDSSGHSTNGGSLQFKNPAYRTYPEWQPEVLPATKHAGDVEVTLLGLHTSYNSPPQPRYDPARFVEINGAPSRGDGQNSTLVDAEVRSLSNSAGAWAISSIRFSDATGNETAGSSTTSWPWEVKNGGVSGEGFSVQPSLWPSEKAWKLQLEVKQTGGFSAENLFSFKNVPLGAVGASTAPRWTTNFASIALTLDSTTRQPPYSRAGAPTTSSMTVMFTNSQLPAGTHLDLLSMVDDQGTTNRPSVINFSTLERIYSYDEIPLGAKTATFNFAVHQSRTVEFTVHPELPPTDGSPARDRIP